MSYDPKRSRAHSPTADDDAPVDELLGPTPAAPALAEPAAPVITTPAEARPTVDPRVVAAAAAAAVLLVIWWRRR
jgi:hypothetical protein